MENILFIAIAIFLITIFGFWKLTNAYFKKQYGEKLWKQWGTRLFFWQGVIYTCTGITILVLFLLKWASIIAF